MKIALGVTGGVAAYKAAELVRRLQQEKLDVQVVMTRAAQEFITPLTFAALTGKKVITEMFAPPTPRPPTSKAPSSISPSRSASISCSSRRPPPTFSAKFAHGIADDFLGTLYLATKAPVIVAPAMNVNMWEHPATQENLATLRARGVHVVDPDEGYLACGMTGAGRLAATEAIAKKYAPCSACAAISRAAPCSSPPAPRAKISILSASSPIAPPARWATRWPKPPSAAAPA